jgi:hypothetical protein
VDAAEWIANDRARLDREKVGALRECLRVRLSVLERFDPLDRLVGALVCLFRAGDCRDGSAMQGCVSFPRGDRTRLGDGRTRVGRTVEWCLLLVEDVAAQVLGALVVVELRLVCVAAVLGETQFGLTSIDRSSLGIVMITGAGPVGVESSLCFVDALLIVVGADLFTFGDALVQVDQCLFLVEFVLLAGP